MTTPLAPAPMHIAAPARPVYSKPTVRYALAPPSEECIHCKAKFFRSRSFLQFALVEKPQKYWCCKPRKTKKLLKTASVVEFTISLKISWKLSAQIRRTP